MMGIHSLKLPQWLPPVARRFALKKNEEEDIKKKARQAYWHQENDPRFEATCALDSSYLNRILLDDCVALCWKVSKLSNKNFC